AGAVGAHFAGAGDVEVGQRVRQWCATGAGGGDDLGHDAADERFAFGGGEELVGRLVEDGGEAVEGDVPDELFPAAVAKVGQHVTRNLAIVEDAGNVIGKRAGAALEMAEADVAVGGVVDRAGA